MTGGENEDETGAREASSPPLMTMREHHLGLRQRRVGHGGRREGDEDATTRTTRTEEEEEEEEEGSRRDARVRGTLRADFSELEALIEQFEQRVASSETFREEGEEEQQPGGSSTVEARLSSVGAFEVVQRFTETLETLSSLLPPDLRLQPEEEGSDIRQRAFFEAMHHLHHTGADVPRMEIAALTRLVQFEEARLRRYEENGIEMPPLGTPHLAPIFRFNSDGMVVALSPLSDFDGRIVPFEEHPAVIAENAHFQELVDSSNARRAQEGFSLGAVESDFDVQRAVHADEDERQTLDETENTIGEVKEEFESKPNQQWRRFDELIAEVRMRRMISYCLNEEESDDERGDESDEDDYEERTKSRERKIERKLIVPKNWRMSADGNAVPAKHRRGLRSILIPGRVWFGTIWIPGSEKKSRYTFRVLFWDEERERLVCSHSAQGDEQIFYLHVEEQGEESDDALHISFRDNETFCDGQVFPNGVIRGQVRQMIRGSEGHYEPANETQNLFELKIAKWTPNAKSIADDFWEKLEQDQRNAVADLNRERDHPLTNLEERNVLKMLIEDKKMTLFESEKPMLQNRKLLNYHLQRKRWALSRDILPSLKDVMLYVKNLETNNEFIQRSMMGALARRTKLLSFPSDSMCLRNEEDEIAQCQDNSLGGHVYYDELEMSNLESIEEEPEAPAMKLFDPVSYSAHLVEFRHDDRAQIPMDRVRANKDGELRVNELIPEEVPSSCFLKLPSTVDLKRTCEIRWYQFWEIAKYDGELLSASLRETAMELQNRIFATPREKLIDLSKRHRIKHKAHADMSDRASTAQAVLWRLIMDSKYMRIENQVRFRNALRMGIFAENVIEARMMQAYKLLDDSFNAYANRVPLSKLADRVTPFQKPDPVAPDGRPVTPNTLKSVCAICLVDFEENDRVLTLECNHIFHESCAKEWLFNSTSSCPNCRKHVDDGVGDYLVSLSKEERAELTHLVDDAFVRETFLERDMEDAYDRAQREMRELQQVSEEELAEEENRYL
jgi:hypothetical protein